MKGIGVGFKAEQDVVSQTVCSGSLGGEMAREFGWNTGLGDLGPLASREDEV